MSKTPFQKSRLGLAEIWIEQQFKTFVVSNFQNETPEQVRGD